MKKRLCGKWMIRVMAGLLGLMSLTGLASCEDDKPKGEVMVYLKDEGSLVAVSWAMATEYERQADKITVNLQHIQNGTPSGTLLIASLEPEGPRCIITDILAYYAQERELGGAEWTIRAEVIVRDTKGKILARNLSEQIVLRDFFPPEEAPVLGQDIPLDKITSFSSSGSGSLAEDNYSYMLINDRSLGMITFHGSYILPTGSFTISKAITEKDWQRMIDYISHGTLYRGSITDPTLERLDGSDSYMSIEWEGMSRSDGYYNLSLPEEMTEEIHRWFMEFRE
ncbi:MAG: hypothetical protein IJM90_07945 [Firmicutes bacterium]|nr:hypothetical protein [Bacillota bacterium]